MTKWFDTNYHYLVPEIGPETDFALASDRIVREFEEALANGFVTRPVIVGPVTFLLLSKATDDAPAGFRPLSRLEDLLPVYAELLDELAAAGASWVQLDEPAARGRPGHAGRGAPGRRRPRLRGARRRRRRARGSSSRPRTAPSTRRSAARRHRHRGPAPRPLQGRRPVRRAALAALGSKTLVGGVIDGHNIWRGDLAARRSNARRAAARSSATTSPSARPPPPLHVPHDVEDEAGCSRAAEELARLRRPEGRRGRRRSPGCSTSRDADPAGHRASATPRHRRPRRRRRRARAPSVRDRTAALDRAPTSAAPTTRVREAAQDAGSAPAAAADHHHRLLPADRRDPHRPRPRRQGRARPPRRVRAAR